MPPYFKSEKFFAYVRGNLFGGSLSQNQVDGLNALLHAFFRYGSGRRSHLAYVLATAQLETGSRIEPVRETFADSDAEAVRRLDRSWKNGRLGNTPVSKRYWQPDSLGRSWFGRGFVQLTHEFNYQGELRDAVLAEFGVDIHLQPDQVMNLEISAFIIVYGMTHGTFSGKSMDDYLNDRSKNYTGARAVVNGNNKARTIAGFANKYERALTDAGMPAPAPAGPKYTGRLPLASEASGDDVRDLQALLKQLGYHEVGEIDGLYGRKTRAATSAMLLDNGLPLNTSIPEILTLEFQGDLAPRSLSVARKTATKEAVADREEVQDAGVGKTLAVALGLGPLIGKGAADATDFAGIAQNFKAVGDIAGTLTEYLPFLFVAVGAVFIWTRLRRIESKQIERYRKGEI